MKRCNRIYSLCVCIGVLLLSHCSYGMLLKGGLSGKTLQLQQIRKSNNRVKRQRFREKTKLPHYQESVKNSVNNVIKIKSPLAVGAIKAEEIRKNIWTEELPQTFEVAFERLELTGAEIRLLFDNFKDTLRDVVKELLENYENAPFSQGISQEDFRQKVFLDVRIQLLIGKETSLTNLFEKLIQSFVEKVYQSIMSSYVKRSEVQKLVENSKKLGKKQLVKGQLRPMRVAISPKPLIEISQYDPTRFLRLEETGKLTQLAMMPDYVRNELLTQVRKEFPRPQDRIDARAQINKNWISFLDTGLSPHVQSIFQKALIRQNPTLSSPEATELAQVIDLSLSFKEIGQRIQNNVLVEDSDEAIHLFLSQGLAIYDVSAELITQMKNVNPLVQDFLLEDFQSIKTFDENGVISSIVIKRPDGGLVFISSGTNRVPFDQKTFERAEKNFWSQPVEDIVTKMTVNLFSEKKEIKLLELPEEGRFEEIFKKEPSIVEIEEKEEFFEQEIGQTERDALRITAENILETIKESKLISAEKEELKQLTFLPLEPVETTELIEAEKVPAKEGVVPFEAEAEVLKPTSAGKAEVEKPTFLPPAELKEDIAAREQAELARKQFEDAQKILQEIAEAKNMALRLAEKKAGQLVLRPSAEMVEVKEGREQLPIPVEERKFELVERPLEEVVKVTEESVFTKETLDTPLEAEQKEGQREAEGKGREREKEREQKEKGRKEKERRPDRDGRFFDDRDYGIIQPYGPRRKKVDVKKYPSRKFTKPLRVKRPRSKPSEKPKPPKSVADEQDQKDEDGRERELESRDDRQYPEPSYSQDGFDRPSDQKRPATGYAPGEIPPAFASGAPTVGSGADSSDSLPARGKKSLLWVLLAFLLTLIAEIIRRRYMNM